MKSRWKKATLGDTCEMYQPKTISGKEMVEGGAYPVFGANGIIGRYDKYNHEEPQLLITCRGATCGSVNVSEPKSWVTGNAMVVRPKNGAIGLRFLEYLFRGGIDITKAITGAAQPQITRTNLAPLEITYPDSGEEQQRIVGILDAAFDGIATAKANAEKNLQNARALFESHLQSVFTQRGEGWVEKPLGDVCEYVNGKAHEQCINEKGQYIVINSKFISSDGSVFKKSDQALSLLHPGDIAMVLSDVPNGKALAKCFLVEEADTFTLNQRICLIRSKKFHTKFLFYQLNRNRHFLAFDNGENQTNMRLNQVLSCPLFLPPISEQESIATRLDALKEETHRLESLYQRKLAALDALKKSLLHQAFSGQL